MDGARGKEWLRAREHHLCLLQTQFSSLFFFKKLKKCYICAYILPTIVFIF